MFQLTKEEVENLKFQFGTSNWGGIRKLPYAFIEQGIANLSSVFPEDYMFQLTEGEVENLTSQIVTSSISGLRFQNGTLEQGRGKHRKYLRHSK